MKKRILILITELRPGGAEQVVLSLAEGLRHAPAGSDACGFEPVVAALDGRGEVAQRLRDAGVEVIDLHAYSRWRLDVIPRLTLLLFRRKFDLIHAHLIHASLVARLAARPLGIPVLCTSHIVDRRPVGWHFTLDRWTAPWCAKLSCVSEAVRRYHQEKTGLPDEWYTVVLNGIDLSRFTVTRAEARRELGLRADDLVVGALGRFDPQKGFDVYLRAVAEPALCGRNVVFLLAGYGEEEARLKTLAESLGVPVRFCGYQKEPQRFWPALDVAVVPSRWEGFGLVVAEAMACGVPVVASGVDSIPELMEDRRHGLLVAPDNPAALAGAVSELLDDATLRRQLAEAARERASRFSVAEMVDGYSRLYASLLVE